MRHIETCRTAELGGHVDQCDTCGHQRISYNSCRDRHCPKCQNLKKAQWLEERLQRLLPAPYFHVVFTIPAELNPLALRNKRAVFDILFHAAAQTLRTIATDPKHLGAEVGFTAILHTWGQNLLFHPHLHCVVTGGGLTEGGGRWVPARERYLLPVKVLGSLFRGKFLSALKQARDQQRLRFEGSTEKLRHPARWHGLLDDLYRKDWVVYAKPPFGGADVVFRYLGRYTHRVAISNHRLLALHDGEVAFQMTDYASAGRRKRMKLCALEFIRRFLLHVLPKGFVRIRHFGLCAACNVGTKLEQARRLLTAVATPTRETGGPWWERLLRLTGIDIMSCPRCGVGRLIRGPGVVPDLLPGGT